MFAKLFRESSAVARRILIELWRRKRSLIFWSLFPVFVLILNGLILEERAQLTQGEAFQQAASPTLVGAALFFSCLGGSVATVVAEREQQTLKRLFLSPLSGLSYCGGIFLAHCAIGLGQTFLVWAIATTAGATFDGNLLLALSIILLSIATYVGVGFILGTQFARRTEDVNALIAAFGVPLLILGGAFFPTSLFPDSLLNLAEYNPVYHMILALTAALTNTAPWEEIIDSYTFLAIFAGIMIATGWVAYRRLIALERQL